MPSVTEMPEREGIAVAGTILVDRLCEIGAYPKAGELTQIKRVSLSAGGLVPNDGIDLKKLDPSLPVYAYGKVGNDDEGRFALEQMKLHGVDVSGVIVSDAERTGFTDVMSVVGGQRTFFTCSGANATFGANAIPWGTLSCKMFHLGYFLLMEAIDNGNGLQILKWAKERGILTSIDLVSENSDRYAGILPCLPYVDNLIVNETEAGNLCGVEPTDENLPLLASILLDAGVRDRVIIHTPKQAVCKSRKTVSTMPSYDVPKGWIKGTTGAGDAFCSGALLGIYYAKSDREILEYAQTAATASLRTTDATGGLAELSELQKLMNTFL